MKALIHEYLSLLRWQDILDILIVAYLFYRILLLIRGTRAVQMAAGLAVLILMYFVAGQLQLLTLHWLLGTFLSSIFLVVIIVFQDDIRRALIQMGKTPFIKARTEYSQIIEEIVKAVTALAEKKIGALIVIERGTGLREFIESGVPIEAKVTRDLLISIFQKESPLHDGAVIIREGRVAVAGAILPLSTNPKISSRLGTRHRAAIGISEVSDAVAIVVSEERGTISVALGGKITRDIEPSALRRLLLNILGFEEQNRWWRRRLFK
ncbi:MAG TPA: TIGR00159 family protein [Thermodesulfatator atlanticus]|uniref:Diadenylate cyclase n=1 Tax=Thermodesulfatator atlanticus TaxID=501497 RepID=A0A7V5P1C3_9BACT|nr:TIGR00159 family protein [Thermodesulfatator atlanticus]